MPEPTPVEPSAESFRRDRFVIAWAVTLGVLLAVTWPLWTPWRSVPRIAPFAWQGVLPPSIDWLFLLMIGFGLIRAGVSKAYKPIAILIATLGLMALMSVDQLRWQPWAYHAALAGGMLVFAPAWQAIRGLRWLAIAVYAFSALAKLDAEFAATLGQQMLGVFAGEGLETWSEATRTKLALSLPAGELLLAGLLAISLRVRLLARPVCLAAVAMHFTTIAVLSPWGLNHSWGVLLWNAGFAWQTVALFWPEVRREESEPRVQGSLVATAALLLGVAVPLGTPLELWDQWPGWALYSPGGERATLLVHSVSVDDLPDSLGSYVDGEDQSDGPWRRVRVDDWVLAETWAPVYPQNRITAAIAVGLFEQGVSTNHLRLVSESAANRLNRERQTITLDSVSAINRASQLLRATPAVVWTGTE